MVMLPSTMRYDPQTNRSFIYTKNSREQSGLSGELLFLDVPNDHLHFRMCTEYLPNNMFSYKLSQASQDQEGVFLVEFGEEELVSPKGRIMDLQGIYRFVVREVAPLRDTALYRIVRDTFLERDQPPWYPENASILVMVPFMHEDSDIEDLWLGVGKPLDPPTSYTIEDVDDWIVQAVARETGGGGTLNKPKNEEGVTMNNANAVAEKEPNESSAAPKGESGVSPEDIDWVVRQTGCPRAHVVQALKAYNGDMVNAMIYLTESDQSAKA